MATYDLSIENGKVHMGGDLIEANLAIEGGKIVAISKESFQADRKMNAAGKIILPGIIDLHSHIRDPGYTYKEDFETGSRAAAAGGVTMLVDMPNVEPPTNSLKTFEDKKAIAAKKSIVDFNHFVFPAPSEVAKVAESGAAGYKIFMVRGAYPHDPRICVEDHAQLYEMFTAVQKTGLPCLVHPSNMAIFESLYREERREHPEDSQLISFGKAYTDELLYSTSVSVLINLAKRTGVRLHLVHTHSETAIELLRRAKAEGYDITAQVDPKYFITTREELDRLGALVFPGGLLQPHRVSKIWNALRTGTIDVIATDHAPHTREEVIQKFKENPWEAPFGCPQLEHYLAVFLDEVNRGSLSLDQLVALASSRPAKIIGVYPLKGAIQVGSDADLAVIDMGKEKVLTDEGTFTKVGWTPYAGRKVRGVPVATVRRGEVIMEGGRVTGKPGSGRFIRPRSKKTAN